MNILNRKTLEYIYSSFEYKIINLRLKKSDLFRQCSRDTRIHCLEIDQKSSHRD